MAGEDVAEVGGAVGLGAADLTGALSADADVLDRTVRALVRAGTALPGVDHVGVALAARGFHPQPTGDPVADALDAVQAAHGEGPGVEVAASGGVVRRARPRGGRAPKLVDVATWLVGQTARAPQPTAPD